MPAPHPTVGHGEHHVFCCHGWFGPSWGSFPQYVDEDAFTYHFISYRGFGDRRDETGDYTLDEISRDLRAQADDLGIDRYSLIGHSMGGVAIQRVLADAPERVRTLIGTSPVGAFPAPWDEATTRLFHEAATKPENRVAIINNTTSSRNTPVWVRQVLEYSLANSDPDAFHRTMLSWSTADFADEIRGNPVPALALVGEYDPAISRDVVTQTWGSVYPNCRIEVVVNASHYQSHEVPIHFATVVEEFMASSSV